LVHMANSGAKVLAGTWQREKAFVEKRSSIQ